MRSKQPADRREVRVHGPAGSVPFGAFLEQQRATRPILRYAPLIGVSRAGYYKLKKGDQMPTLGTVAAALAALGFVDITTRPGNAGHDADTDWDMCAFREGARYEFRWPWGAAERARAHAKFATSTAVGAAVAVTGGTDRPESVAAESPPPQPAALPVLASKTYAPAGDTATERYARWLQTSLAGSGMALLATPRIAPLNRLQRAVSGRRDPGPGTPPADRRTQLLADLASIAEQLSTEDLEVLLQALREVRDGIAPAAAPKTDPGPLPDWL